MAYEEKLLKATKKKITALLVDEPVNHDLVS